MSTWWNPSGSGIDRFLSALRCTFTCSSLWHPFSTLFDLSPIASTSSKQMSSPASKVMAENSSRVWLNCSRSPPSLWSLTSSMPGSRTRTLLCMRGSKTSTFLSTNLKEGTKKKSPANPSRARMTKKFRKVPKANFMRVRTLALELLNSWTIELLIFNIFTLPKYLYLSPFGNSPSQSQWY